MIILISFHSTLHLIFMYVDQSCTAIALLDDVLYSLNEIFI